MLLRTSMPPICYSFSDKVFEDNGRVVHGATTVTYSHLKGLLILHGMLHILRLLDYVADGTLLKI